MADADNNERDRSSQILLAMRNASGNVFSAFSQDLLTLNQLRELKRLRTVWDQFGSRFASCNGHFRFGGQTITLKKTSSTTLFATSPLRSRS
jgi:hypothetical protein